MERTVSQRLAGRGGAGRLAAGSDVRDLAVLIDSRYPLVYVESGEEERVVALVGEVARRLRLPLFTWSVTEGLARQEAGFSPMLTTRDPAQVLEHIAASDLEAIYLLRDFHPYLDDPRRVRRLREIAMGYRQRRRAIVLLSPQAKIPEELGRLCTRFTPAVPDAARMVGLIEAEIDRYRATLGAPVRFEAGMVEALARALAGLSEGEAVRAVRAAIAADGALTRADRDQVLHSKKELVERDSLLTLELESTSFANVGGLAGLRRWLMQRKDGFSTKARDFGLEPPRGILLVGVQGCGKSLAARAIAALWELPLLKLDAGRLYDKYVGESERNLRKALATAAAMAPAVLWFDEIEKGLATGNGDADGGLGRRILGSFLTWLQEREAPVFVAATANDIAALPPELLRKGRFDEIFFVDLPAVSERKAIFALHLTRRDRDADTFDLDRLAAASDGFSGAEIEQAVVSGLYAAFSGPGHLTTELLLEELAATRPLSVTMAEKVAALRAWAAPRTVPAGGAESSAEDVLSIEPRMNANRGGEGNDPRAGESRK